MNLQVTPRLVWVLENNVKVQQAVKNEDALLGTLESFVLYRLRQGKVFREIEHIAEVTNCAATGLYDPFTLGWAEWGINMFRFKTHMFPKVVDNSYDYGNVHESYFGCPIKITGVMSDQSASIFGNCCFGDGDAKVTLGTGTFFNINTKKCHASILGLYPLVAWNLKGVGINYCVEGSSSDTATIVNWGKSIGLFEDVQETSSMAESVDNSQNVFFIPAFSGLSAPINDFRAASGFIGVSADTTKNHLVRALLESIVFRVAQLINSSMKETDYKIKLMRVDGGVSNNDFVCQFLADLCGIIVERSGDAENTSLGIAFLCAYNLKLKSIDELKKSYNSGKIFTPRRDYKDQAVATMKRWEQAVERFKGWY